MNKLLWLIPAALAVLIICICIQSCIQDAGAGRYISISIPAVEDPGTLQLHEMPAEEIAAEFIRHNNNISSYSATIRKTGETDYENDEYRFFAQRPDRFRAEYIRSEIHGNGTIVAANRTFVWQYHPDTGTAEPYLIDDPHNTFFAWKDYPAIAARILEKNPAVLNGTGYLDGSNAVIIEAEVKGVPTEYYPDLFTRIRIWIDEDTLMMKRMALIGNYNETVLAVDMWNTSINPRISDEMFDFVPPYGTEISPTIAELFAPLNQSSMHQAKERFGRDFMIPEYLPPGYAFRYCLHYREMDGRDSIVYSNDDGDLVFTQALQENNASFAAPAGQGTAIRIGNRTGTFWQESGKNFTRWNCGNGMYELAGIATKDDLARIAQSLSAPALLNFAPDDIKDPERIAEIALRDPSARRMVDSGGEIFGVGMSIKRSTKTIQGGVFPALIVRYNRLLVDFQVDPISQRSAGRTIQVPNGGMIDHEENRTVVKYNGEILFIFDPMEEGS